MNIYQQMMIFLLSRDKKQRTVSLSMVVEVFFYCQWKRNSLSWEE